MHIKIQHLWYRLRASFWFVPGLMTAASVCLSLVITTGIDKLFLYHAVTQPWWLYSGGPDGAHTVLSVISGSMITVAGVVFSITIVVLICYIHSVSESIQAQNIIARVRRDLDNAVDRIFPEKLEQKDDLSHGPAKRDYDIPTTCDRDACQVKAEHSGYLQAVDNDVLMRIAVEENLLVHLGYRPGNFITMGSVLVTVWPGKNVDEALSEKINAIFILGPERTLEQDVEFAISQLVEIAVRALSPGINDPITALTTESSS